MASMEYCQLQCYDKYVSRTMRCLPDKFKELCHSHLAILLDLSGDKLEHLLSVHEEVKKKKSGLSSVGMFKKKDKSQGLFGLPLTDGGVCLMMPLIHFLTMETNVTKEGLFRKTGNRSRMTTLRELLIAHGPAVSIDPGIFSAHDVACVLKEFIRELPEPLLTERHLEAHMQILALGQHAKTLEELSGYSSRKLSAAQLLMLLLPSPVQILTMHLVQLLKRTAESPQSKMTSATLGTIFAPIFFIDKKVEATDLLCQISKTAPAASFVIEKANELFQAPKELAMDLRRFWKSMKQSLLHTENNESGQMQTSPSGQTLYTEECYDEENLSRCDDDPNNITAELANLLEDMQKHKNKAKKTIDAPEFYAVLCRRSRSISSSIKKRLPSLKRIRNRQGDSWRFRASSASIANFKTATTAEAHLFQFSQDTPETRCSLQTPNPGQKRHYFSEKCPTDASSNNTPVKWKCQDTGTCKSTRTDAANSKVPYNAGCEALVDCSADTPETSFSLQLPKPGQKRRYTSENCPTAAPSCSNNLPVRQKCQETGICKTAMIDTDNRNPLSNTGCDALLTSIRSITNVVSDFDENINPRGLTSDHEEPITCGIENKENLEDLTTCDIENKENLEDLTTCDIENKENLEDLTTCDIENKHSTRHISHCNRESSPVNSCKRQKQSGSALTSASGSVLKPASSHAHLHKPGGFQSETSNGYLQHYWPHRKITTSVNTSSKTKPATNTSQRTSRKPRTIAMSHRTIRLDQDNILETSL